MSASRAGPCEADVAEFEGSEAEERALGLGCTEADVAEFEGAEAEEGALGLGCIK